MPASSPGSLTALIVRGSYRGASGHDHHTRMFVRHLAARGIAIELIDFPEWHPVKLPDALRDPWFEALTTPVDAKIGLQFCMPHQVVSMPGRLTVNYTMFEATRVPAEWIARGCAHDLIVVPTESSRMAWLTSGGEDARLRLCPLGVDVGRFRPDVEPLAITDPGGRPVSEYATRVLNVSEPGPRKNLRALLRTWIRATTRDDDAILIVKLGRAAKLATLQLLRDLATMTHTIGKSRDEAAPILLINPLLADADMPRLFAAATHYWSMSHGEGWDQPMIEAAATDLRLIAPRHSAYVAYLDDTVAEMIPTRVVPADASTDAWTCQLFAGAEWWEPEENAAADAVTRAVAKRDGPRASPRERVAASFTWEHATTRLLAILDALPC